MEEVKGIVEKINSKGVRIDGRWYNYSKYMQEDAPELNEGDEIRVDVNGDWIMRFKSLSHQPSDTKVDRTVLGGSGSQRVSRFGATKVKEDGFYGEKGKRSFIDRQVIVTRLACLNTATEVLKSHTKPITSKSLFKVAKELEDWVWRGIGEEEISDHGPEQSPT
jgi:hypothetical protein